MIKYKKDNILQLLKEKLKENNNTYADIVDNRLLSGSTLQKLRNNEMISIDNLNRLCCLLDMDIDDLIEYVEVDTDKEFKNKLNNKK